MKRGLVLALVLLPLLFLSACVSQPYAVDDAPAATLPEVKVVEKVVVQCADGSSANSVEQCPKVKTVQPETNTTSIAKEDKKLDEPKVQIAKKLLDESKSKFKGYAYLIDDRVVINFKNLSRHYFLRLDKTKDGTPITDVYMDHKEKTAVAYCNIDREARINEGSFDFSRSQCKDYLNKKIPVEYSDWKAIKGPMQYLEEFANLKPKLIENNIQTISIGGTSKTIQPSLHYTKNGVNYILRIDRRYKVPLKIEIEGERAIDFRDVYFDVMVLDGKPQKIDESWMAYEGISEFWSSGTS